MNPIKKKIPVIFDVTRILNRGQRSTPTGIDRVDLAYLQELRLQKEISLHLIVFGGLGPRQLTPSQASVFVDSVIQRWRIDSAKEESGQKDAIEAWLNSSGALPAGRIHAVSKSGFRRFHANLSDRLDRLWAYLRARSFRLDVRNTAAIYLNTSHGQFFRPYVSKWLRATGIHAIFFIHDLIPIEHPEFNRKGEDAKHLLRMQVVSQFANYVIVNSEVTSAALKSHLNKNRLRIPGIKAISLGTDFSQRIEDRLPALQAERPYFVILSTIEPRKNHILLLRCWQKMVEELGQKAPRLIIIGRRGWNNERVFDFLDNSSLMGGHLLECNDLDDCEVAAIVRGARALLMPSKAEGYSLSIIEALQLGVPVIASDIPIHREVAGEFAEYLDPDDVNLWVSRLISYAKAASADMDLVRRNLANYSAPTWRVHFQEAISIMRLVSKT